MLFKSDNTELEIPIFVHEIILYRYISFNRKRTEWHELLVKDKFEGNDIEKLQDCLLEVLPMLVDGDLSELPFYEKVEGINFMLDVEFKGVLSLWHIYTHLLNLIESYKPIETLDYSFEWFDIVNGKTIPTTYYVEPDRAKRLLTRKHYTSGEYIELKEYERKVEQSKISKAKKDGFTEIKDPKERPESYDRELILTGDKKGNLAFALSKWKLAILARPEGERLPLNKSERESLIERRRKLFNEITLDIYLNVGFFLLSIVKGLNLKEIINPFISQRQNHFMAVRRKEKVSRNRKK